MKFSVFYAMVGSRPSPEHSIDRIDNNGHYSCGTCEECLANNWTMNVRWATRCVQANNTRANVKITIDGITKNLAHWCRERNLCFVTVFHRLKAGISPAVALDPAYRGIIVGSKKTVNHCIPYKGVTPERKKFRARILVNGKSMQLGTFDTPEEAAIAYNDAGNKYRPGAFQANKISN